jgi:hypothetical protein
VLVHDICSARCWSSKSSCKTKSQEAN